MHHPNAQRTERTQGKRRVGRVTLGRTKTLKDGERRRRKDGRNESGNIVVGEMRVRIAKRKIGGGGREDRGEVMMRVIAIGVEAGVEAEDTKCGRHSAA